MRARGTEGVHSRQLGWLGAVVCATALAGCDRAGLLSATRGDFVVDDLVDFGDTWLGAPATRRLTIQNRSAAGLEVALTDPGAPFTLAPAVLVVPGAETTAVDVTFAPTAEGVAVAEVTVTAGELHESVLLRGTGARPPDCGAAAPCRARRFDAAAGRCVEETLADGADCSATRCMAGARCVAGECVGLAVDCSDGDACTVDVCDARSGCLHRPRVCPAPENPCQVAVCDPARGCDSLPAPDGTACGPTDCVTAEVCLAGRCTSVRAPDGLVCAPATPCTAEARCANQQCAVQAPATLRPAWTYRPPAGVGLDFDVGLQLDLAGNVYTRECAPSCRSVVPAPSTWLVSLSPTGQLRYRLPLPAGVARGPYERLTQLISDGLVVTTTGGLLVSAFDASTGQPVWTADLSGPLQLAAGTGSGVTGLAAPAPGRLVAAVHDGPTGVGFVVGLSTVNGGVAFTERFSAVAPELIADELGMTYATVSMGAANTVQLDGQGTVVGRLATPATEAAAAYGGILADRGGMAHVGGASATWESFGVPGFSTPGVHVLQAGPVLLDGRGAVVFRTVGGGTGTGAGDQTVSWAIDRGSSVAWSWSAPRFDYARTGFLLANGDVGYLYGVGGSRFSLLVLRQGKEVLRCPLQTDNVLDGALEAGRLVVMRPDFVAGYDAPGLSLAATGWVTTRGDVTRAGRPR